MEPRQKVEELSRKLKIDEKRERVRFLETEAQRPDFWLDQTRAGLLMKELALLKKEIEEVELLKIYLGEGSLGSFAQQLKHLEKLTFFSGPYDHLSALLSLHAGQGGVEAMDWTGMLKRMYQRFAEAKGFSVNPVDETPGEEAGIKSSVFEVIGPYAYGHLKYEAGVHRLVRQSPFNSDKLRQTSFAMVEVIPLIDEADAPAQIKDEDIEFSSFRASGHGGQNVNKVSTAVRLKHRLSGITVTCQAERSQAQNRERAMRILRSRLLELEEERRRHQISQLKGEYKKPGWGNQIRSYVLHPYKLVKDLRTEFESHDPEAILDGALDGLIETELRFFA